MSLQVQVGVSLVAVGRAVIATAMAVVMVMVAWNVTKHEHAQPCGSCSSALATGHNSPVFIPSQTV